MIRFVELPNGQRVTFAGLMEDFLFNELKLPFSSVDCNGDSHPGTKLNAIAKELYSRKYAATFKLTKQDWFCVEKGNSKNIAFIEEMLAMQFTTRRAVYNGEKLDCYTMDFMMAVIAYLAADIPNFPEVTVIPAAVYRTQYMPEIVYKEWSKPRTAASPLFTITAEEEAEVRGSVISTFSEEEQAVIREYIARCKNTLDARRRAREKEKTNGKIGCSN